MLDELNEIDVPGAAARPQPTSAATSAPRSLDHAGAFDVASATRAAVERALPSWRAERRRLNEDRIRRPETRRGDRLVLGFVRVACVIAAVGVAATLAAVVYSAAGWIAAIAVGLVGLTVALAAASGGALLTQALFDRSDRARREAVARLELAIRVLDERISQAFLYHGLVGHTRSRTSF
jgi:hypothetical protein